MDALIEDEDGSGEEEGDAVDDVELEEEEAKAYGKPIQVAEDGESKADKASEEFIADLSWDEGQAIKPNSFSLPTELSNPLNDAPDLALLLSTPSSPVTSISNPSVSPPSPGGDSARAVIMLSKQDELCVLLCKAWNQKIDEETIGFHTSAYLQQEVFNEDPNPQPIVVSPSPMQIPQPCHRTSIATPIQWPVLTQDPKAPARHQAFADLVINGVDKDKDEFKILEQLPKPKLKLLPKQLKSK